MNTYIDTVDNTLKKSALLVSQQSSWKWQQRLRRVEYVPVIRKRDGVLVWGTFRETSNRISGGNLRSPYVFRGEQSPRWSELTPEECLCIYAYGLQTF